MISSQAYALVGSIDIAGNSGTGDSVFSQPPGIGQVNLRSAAGETVEVFHFPEALDILRAFQLLDDLTDRKLSGNPAPGFVVGIVPVQHHERIGMAENPA